LDTIFPTNRLAGISQQNPTTTKLQHKNPSNSYKKAANLCK